MPSSLTTDNSPIAALSSRPGHTRRDTDFEMTDRKEDDKDARAFQPTEHQLGLVDDTETASTSDGSTSNGRLGAAYVVRDAVAGDSDDPSKWTTTRKELFAWYAYYIGNSGLPTYNFGPIAFQNLLSLASTTDFCGGTDQPDCTLRFSGLDRTPANIVLLCNGFSTALQAAIFLTVGPMADFGRGRPWILIISTVVTIAISFAWLGVTDPSQWRVGAGLYIIGLVGYQVCLTFWQAALIGLSRNMPVMQKSFADLSSNPPAATPEQHYRLDYMTRNRINNIAFLVCSIGEVILLAAIQGMLEGLHANQNTETNTKAMTYVIAFGAAAWVVTAVPWFLVEQHRPGRPLPPGKNIITAGLDSAWQAAKHIWTLKQSLLYLVFYFLMSDALNTSVTQISIVQAQVVSFSATTSNLLLLVGIAAQAVGIGLFWLIQRRWQVQTFTMLRWVCFFIILLQGWGFIGIFTQKLGFHNEWEVWFYQGFFYSILICPWYAVSQTAISEITPTGYEFQFFALYSLLGKTSAFIGPFVSTAISQRTGGNENTPFYFLGAMAIVSSLVLIPIDAKKAKIEQAQYLKGRGVSEIGEL